MKKSELIPKIAGIIFLTFGIIAIFNQIYLGTTQGILWFCYIGLIILGLGFLKKDSFLIESQINILAIPLTIWCIDFIYFILTKHPLWGVTDYFFMPGPIISKIITLQHLFAIPLALYSIKFLKKDKNDSMIFSMLQVSMLFVMTRFFSTAEQNINWVYHTSLNINLHLYPLLWFIAMFLIVFLTNILIRKINYKKMIKL